MNLRVTAAIAACKLTRAALRLLHRGGTALPGRVALKLCPNLLGYLARGVQSIAVTGTNGKTTCSRMLEQAFRNAGMPYFANRSGANLITGITADFAANATLSGKPKRTCAVIECDEAACKHVLGLLKPRVLIVTNLFRDQLDRYGEITHTLDNIRLGIRSIPDAVLCLNADCSLTASIALDAPNKCVFYGVDTPIYTTAVDEVSDAPHCIRCKAEYRYDWRTYGHLGGFRCPECGYSRQAPQVSVTQVLAMDADSSTVMLRTARGERQLRIGLGAGYNIYNAAASVTGLLKMGFSEDDAVHAVENFRCGFGRMEKFTLDGAALRMILVKNPAGCNQVMHFLSGLTEESAFAVCLNDRTADGTDVSWIWDADFEKLGAMGETLTQIFVSGDRALDMALRLKYAGVPDEKLHVIPDYDALIGAMTACGTPVFIMPTYTAMLALREKLSRRSGAAEFWE